MTWVGMGGGRDVRLGGRRVGGRAQGARGRLPWESAGDSNPGTGAHWPPHAARPPIWAGYWPAGTFDDVLHTCRSLYLPSVKESRRSSKDLSSCLCQYNHLNPNVTPFTMQSIGSFFYSIQKLPLSKLEEGVEILSMDGCVCSGLGQAKFTH